MFVLYLHAYVFTKTYVHRGDRDQLTIGISKIEATLKTKRETRVNVSEHAAATAAKSVTSCCEHIYDEKLCHNFKKSYT